MFVGLFVEMCESDVYALNTNEWIIFLVFCGEYYLFETKSLPFSSSNRE